MRNMDKRDLQIMEVLAQNCRIAHTTLAKALNVSKDTVAYKIKQLEKADVLSQYVLFIDARKLGFTRYHLLLQFEEGLDNKEKIYDLLRKHEFVMWINTFIGRFDIQIIVDATNSFHLDKIRQELFVLCNNKVKDYIMLTHISDFEFTQLNPVLDLGTKFEKKSDHSFSSMLTTRKFPVDREFNIYSPTSYEVEILKVLADNPNESLISMSKMLKIDRQTVKRKINNLIKNKIILSFGGIPNLSELGFVTYYILVRLIQDTPLNIRKKPFQQLRNIFYAGNTLGNYDLLLYLNARNPKELNDSIELFKKDIGPYIVHYDLLVQDKVHYWKQFSDGIYNQLKSEKK
ncbi:hypothetical protein COV18_03990 [Candidatus Woesearchaeota archaeon CG10_big_fil_rev_8_21_14_0_10_37_12]|nr:MAG: hypothetical protein COV18_03990 [Candidatus Woesearchaeota archaeon CG10_big_fil_rev_8_21_14_0_10_37_12]